MVGYREFSAGATGPHSTGLDGVAALHQRTHDFLNEEGVAIRVTMDKIDEFGRHLLLVQHAGHERGGFTQIESSNGDFIKQMLAAEISNDSAQWVSLPNLIVAVGPEKQNRHAPKLMRQVVQQIQTGLIGPVQVVNRDDDRH